MRFKMMNGSLVEVKDIEQSTRYLSPVSSTCYVIDSREVKSYIKEMKFLNSKAFSFAPSILLTAVAPVSGAGVFWDAFITYIFPWFLDIASVYCAIKIAQGFFQEKRGGKDDGSGFSGLVTYGKWLLLFHLIPWGVMLIDQIGATMVSNLSKNPLK